MGTAIPLFRIHPGTKPADSELELLPRISLNLIFIMLWMMIGYAVAFAVFVQNKLKPIQAQGLEERS